MPGHKVDIIADDDFDVPGYDPTIQYEPREVRRALWKVDLLILPPIVLCFCFLQFDRTNIGNALTDTFREDINIDNTDINLAQTLFTVGFVITELPFNMISRYFGPERFLPVTMVLWGTVTWCQVFLKSGSGLCAARFFIGALEGGYIPGFALYISKFYSNEELALRYAIFWASNSFAGALGGPLSIGLLSLRGRGGLAGWQWLFLIGEFSCYATRILKTNILHRGRSHLCTGCIGISLLPSRRRQTQNVLRKVVQHVCSTRGLNSGDSCGSK
jgi:sugar phosphate permease